MKFYLCRYINQNKRRITKIIEAKTEPDALKQLQEFAVSRGEIITKLETVKEDVI